MFNLQNYLVQIISYHIFDILLLVNVITELGVGHGDAAQTESLNLKLISHLEDKYLGYVSILRKFFLLVQNPVLLINFMTLFQNIFISGENLT